MSANKSAILAQAPCFKRPAIPEENFHIMNASVILTHYNNGYGLLYVSLWALCITCVVSLISEGNSRKVQHTIHILYMIREGLHPLFTPVDMRLCLPFCDTVDPRIGVQLQFGIDWWWTELQTFWN